MRSRQARPSGINRHHTPRPRPPRRRRPLWPWLLLALLAVAACLMLSRHRGLPLPLPSQSLRRVGIIAGHWQYDPGATCDDGLREVDITLPVARMVALQLNARGYQAEVLGEYPDDLHRYQALAVVSLHADSCFPGLSGFKIVGRSRGAAAPASDRLVDCLQRHYGAATGLLFHESTITPDMIHYHAFGELAPEIPAAIVELGFMSGDRDLLTTHQSSLAKAIAEGLLEFLGSAAEEERTPSPGP